MVIFAMQQKVDRLAKRKAVLGWNFPLHLYIESFRCHCRDPWQYSVHK
jgi:hypothetical protein